MRRFFVRPDAVEAGRVRFDVDETRHLRRVLRLAPGGRVEATDGTGRGFIVRLVAVGADGAVGVIESEAAPGAESPCAITLGQAILKGDRMTWLVQKATELGVARIVPLETARVVARPGQDEGAGQRRRRWERVARETMKQCGRSVAPLVDEPRALAALIQEAPGHDLTWLFWEGGGDPVGRARAEAGPARRVLVLVGPEGGFTPEEVDLARAAGARIVSLGPRTLRAESAGIVAVALCQHVFGDLA